MLIFKSLLAFLLSAALVINPATAEAEEAALVSLVDSGINGLISGQFDGGQALKNAAIAAAVAALSVGVGDLKSQLGIDPGSFAAGNFNPAATLESAVLHGAVGCVGSSLSGQSCGSGFVSGSVSDLANVVSTGNEASDLLLHGLIGGTASQLSGGNFAIGALNSILEEEFNNNQHENAQFRSIVVELGLDKKQQRLLHEEITGQGYDYHEIRAIAIDMFGMPNGK